MAAYDNDGHELGTWFLHNSELLYSPEYTLKMQRMSMLSELQAFSDVTEDWGYHDSKSESYPEAENVDQYHALVLKDLQKLYPVPASKLKAFALAVETKGDLDKAFLNGDTDLLKPWLSKRALSTASLDR